MAWWLEAKPSISLVLPPRRPCRSGGRFLHRVQHDCPEWTIVACTRSLRACVIQSSYLIHPVECAHVEGWRQVSTRLLGRTHQGAARPTQPQAPHPASVHNTSVRSRATVFDSSNMLNRQSYLCFKFIGAISSFCVSTLDSTRSTELHSYSGWEGVAGRGGWRRSPRQSLLPLVEVCLLDIIVSGRRNEGGLSLYSKERPRH
ncbi:hypothetical protein C8R45DRAFT_1079914 [Mycena sanguinolenta]|nr:hypothetical protein C8R45DRAFT_1079914 [Mycena sanguinolenta]